MAVEKTGGGKTGVKFWVYNAEMEGKIGSASTQKVKVTLKPNEDGQSKLGTISGNQKSKTKSKKRKA